MDTILLSRAQIGKMSSPAPYDPTAFRVDDVNSTLRQFKL